MAAYDWKASEPKWASQWKEWELYRFSFRSPRPIYSIDNPPRYASGALHLGHAYQYTVIDFAARYRRLRGDNVFFPLCFDLNGTPVEVAVEKELGRRATEIPRQEFVRACSAFAQGFVAEMTRQFELLGVGMDASIYYQTDAQDYRRLTQISFLRMLGKGLAYKRQFPVNWCPRCRTALAEAEVDYETGATHLCYIQFALEGTEERITVATTRPELLVTCQLVAVHPEDAAKARYVGQRATTPLFHRSVPIITDPKVDPSFGSGFVMICTIGDKEDLAAVMKYQLPLEKAIDEEGRMTELAGKYAGLPVADARQRVIADLQAAGLLLRQEPIAQNLGVCWRCATPIEFLNVPQWFLKTLDFKGEVAALSRKVRWHPEFMAQRLENWNEMLAWDWVVSRQRYFATPIPVWECPSCDFVLPAREAQCYLDPTITPPPRATCPKCRAKLQGCPDVFDTWMDSSITPLYNAFWLRDARRFRRLFPMSLRPQSHDILRTWAYYTLVRSLQLTGERPWENIVITGFIMAPDGTPMHTSRGNIIDPMPLLERYGGDAMRYFAATCSLGTDHAFQEKELVRGLRLVGKLWNVMSFVGSVAPKASRRPRRLALLDRWILARYSEVVRAASEASDRYRFDRAMAALEQFLWHEFADHYLELVKGRAYTKQDASARYTLHTIGFGLLRMASVILPFVAEEAYQQFFRASHKPKSVHVSGWPEPVLEDAEAVAAGEQAKTIVAAVRAWKASRGIPLNTELPSVEVVGPEAARLRGARRDMANALRAKRFRLSAARAVKSEVLRIRPKLPVLGPRLTSDLPRVVAQLETLTGAAAQEAVQKGVELTLEDGRKVAVPPEALGAETRLVAHGATVEALQVGGSQILIQPPAAPSQGEAPSTSSA